MMSDALLLRSLAQNAALLLSLAFLWSLCWPYLARLDPRLRALANGALFGGMGVAGMLMRIEVAPGVALDGRVIVVALAGVFGGPAAALVAGVLVAGYRAWLGGIGTGAGIGAIATGAGLGALVHWLQAGRTLELRAPHYLLLGAALAASGLLWTLAVPDPALAWRLLGLFAIPVPVFFVGGTLLVGLLLSTLGRGREAERERVRLDQEATARAEAEQAGKILEKRLLQQAVVADLGQQALRDLGLSLLMEDATRLIRSTLDVDQCGVLELLPDGSTLALRAGAGWQPGRVGQATVSAGRESRAGQALLSGEPVIIEDLAAETRFGRCPLLREHHVVSGASVIMQSRGRPLGVLVAFTGTQRAFTGDDVRFLQAAAGVLALAMERARAHAERERILSRERGARAEAVSLAEVGRLLSRSLDPAEVGQRIAGSIRTLLGAPNAAVYRLAPESGDLVAVAHAGEIWPGFGLGTVIPSGTSACGLAIALGQPVVTEDILSDSRIRLVPALREEIERSSYRAVLSVPLFGRARIIGALSVGDRAGRVFDDEARRLAESFAAHAALALENAEVHGEVRAARDGLERLSRRLVEAQEAERQSVARELHDALGQLLTEMKIAVETGLPGPAGGGAAALVRLRALVDEMMQRVRELSLALRPAMLDDLGLLPALLWHFGRYTEQTGVHVVLQHRGVDRRFEPGLETAAYRVVQEALTNVARHAGVREVTVRLWAGETTLGVQVEDRGRGLDPGAVVAPGAAGGLAGMRERARLLGGTLAVDSAPGAGTRLTAEFPLVPGTALGGAQA